MYIIAYIFRFVNPFFKNFAPSLSPAVRQSKSQGAAAPASDGSGPLRLPMGSGLSLSPCRPAGIKAKTDRSGGVRRSVDIKAKADRSGIMRRSVDLAAADHPAVGGVQHAVLSGGHRPLGNGKAYAHPAVGQKDGLGLLVGLAVAGLGQAGKAL